MWLLRDENVQKDWEGGIIKGQEETLGGDGYVYHPRCDNMSNLIKLFTLICKVYCISILPL